MKKMKNSPSPPNVQELLKREMSIKEIRDFIEEQVDERT
jgi:hypothetical protein